MASKERITIAELRIDAAQVKKEQSELLKQIQRITEELKKARSEGKLDSETNVAKAAELRRLRAEYSANVKIINALSTTQRTNNKTVAETRTVVAGLTEQWRKMANIYGENDERTKRIADKIKELNAGLAEQNAQLRNSPGFFKKMGDSIKNAAKNLAVFIGGYLGLRAMIRFFKETIAVINEFSLAQSDLAAKLGKTKEEIQDLTEFTIQLGSITKFTAKEVTDLAVVLAKLGLSSEEIMLASEAILDFGAATGATLEESASIVAGGVRAFRASMGEAQRFASVFALAVNKSGLAVEDYTVVLGRVAPVAKRFGLEMEDTIAILAKLRDAKFEASVAAVSFRNILLKLADPTSRMSKEFGGAAKSAEEVFERLKILRNEGADLAKVFELTDVRAAAAFSTMIDAQDDIKALSKEISDFKDSLKVMRDTQLNNLTSDMQILRSVWQGLVLDIDNGEGKISASLRRVAQSYTNFLSDVRLGELKRREAYQLTEKELLRYYDILTSKNNAESNIIKGSIRDMEYRAEKNKLTSEEIISQLRTELGVWGIKQKTIEKITAAYTIKLAQQAKIREQAELDAIKAAKQADEQEAARKVKEAEELALKLLGIELKKNEKILKAQIKLGEREVEILNNSFEAEQAVTEEWVKRQIEKDWLNFEEAMKRDEEMNLQRHEAFVMNEQNKLELAKLYADSDYEFKKQALEKELTDQIYYANKIGADTTKIKHLYGQKQLQLRLEQERAEYSAMADFAGSIAGLFQEQTVIAKVAAIAQATINTYLAATSALATTPGGIIAKGLAFASAIATGLSAVQKIRSVDTSVNANAGYSGKYAPSPSVTSSYIPSSASSESLKADTAAASSSELKAAMEKERIVLVLEEYEAKKANRVIIENSAEM